ncbi:uncharacterized protein TNCV_3648821 [Trichonephila clavipes]|nr:uncharacterized protein TNCV_3648821 [Trichonephila clavipes]
MHVPRSFGNTVIVFTSHLDLTWDKGVDLKFFRVGRSSSRRVWEAYQPKNTDTYTLDLTHCTRLADVYVKWLTCLDDWETQRGENLPWRMVCPILGNGLWKNRWRPHIRRLWPMGCPLTLRSSSIYKAKAALLSQIKQHVESTPLFCSCQRVSSRGQASDHRTLHCHDSQRWPRSQRDVHHGESCQDPLHAQRIAIQQSRELTSSSGTPPVTQECTRGTPTLLQEEQVESAGPRRLRGG